MEQTETSFDAEQWSAVCEQLAGESIRRCGCIHDLYQQIFSEMVDLRLKGIPEVHHPAALEIASFSDYLDLEGRAKAQQEMAEQGYCSHGLEPSCCPMGCGDLSWFADEDGQ